MTEVINKALSVGEKINKQFRAEIDEMLKNLTEDEARSFMYTLQNVISMSLFNWEINKALGNYDNDTTNTL